MWGTGSKGKRKPIDTLIGQHSEVQGDIKFNGGIHIDGAVRGNVVTDDPQSVLQVSDMGSIQGEVRVPYILLNGVVIGDVHSSRHIELSSKARVTGNVYYNLIEMAIGAEVNGKLVHTPEPDGFVVGAASARTADALE
ncbi:MAG: polymer-forming cytoskeletal protein [Gammaproteobacteria bacterium]|nr:polymer-forming cytoskeletal protein [Gammaproteobacteria bacterium]